MTEQTLEYAVKLKKNIDELRDNIWHLEELRELCKSDVEPQRQDYLVEIRGKNSTLKERSVITSESMLIALERDINNMSNELKKLQNEFRNLS